MDLLTEEFLVFKVETIGDAYMVACGHFGEIEDHAVRVLLFGRGCLKMTKEEVTPTGEPLQMRIGINCGPAFCGVVGLKNPRFCFFGDTVNTAARMEQSSLTNAIHVSNDFYDLVLNQWKVLKEKGHHIAEGVQSALNTIENLYFVPRKPLELKGKGIMYTFLYEPSQDVLDLETEMRKTALQEKKNSKEENGENEKVKFVFGDEEEEEGGEKEKNEETEVEEIERRDPMDFYMEDFKNNIYKEIKTQDSDEYFIGIRHSSPVRMKKKMDEEIEKTDPLDFYLEDIYRECIRIDDDVSDSFFIGTPCETRSSSPVRLVNRHRKKNKNKFGK